jgi:hypothetical protein
MHPEKFDILRVLFMIALGAISQILSGLAALRDFLFFTYSFALNL